jgi:hypothetical protein
MMNDDEEGVTCRSIDRLKSLDPQPPPPLPSTPSAPSSISISYGPISSPS